MKNHIPLVLSCAAAMLLSLSNHAGAAPGCAPGRAAKLIHEYTLPSYSMANFGMTQEEITTALANGLKFPDMPSIGSSLERVVGNLYVGTTDRGPTVDRKVGGGKVMLFPSLDPSIILYKAINDQIVPELIIPIVDADGNPVTGVANNSKDDKLYASYTDPVANTIPYNESALDLEGLRILPDGNFIVVEEYSPSIAVINQEGKVLIRYTPVSKPLPDAKYAVKNILPDVLGNRRSNRGFESIALSGDGKTAYVVTQAPLGPNKGSRIVRLLTLDVSNPLNATVVGQQVVLLSPYTDYPVAPDQADLKVSDVEWVAPGKLLFLERATGEVKLVLVDISGAMDVSSLTLEKLEGMADLPPGVVPATTRVIFSMINELPQIADDKLEGLSILNANEVALSNDNDFSLVDPPPASQVSRVSKLWVIRLREQLPVK